MGKHFNSTHEPKGYSYQSKSFHDTKAQAERWVRMNHGYTKDHKAYIYKSKEKWSDGKRHGHYWDAYIFVKKRS